MKYVILLASVVVQLCLGGLYAWSTFVPSLKSSCGLSTAQTQVVFGSLIAVFTLTMVFAGRMLESRGPRPLLLISGVVFAAGYSLAAFSGGSFWLLWFGISGVAGVATGFGYVCPLSTCMKWFPRHKGLVTGIAVAGFGSGAILLSNLAELELERGVGVLTIFRWVGIAYGSAIAFSGFLIRFPAGDWGRPAGAGFSMGFLLRDGYFLALVCGMFCGTFSGLLVIGNLMPMALSWGITPFHAAAGISAFAVGNAGGRITWGWIADRMGAVAVVSSLFFLALAIGGLLAVASNAVVFILVSLLIGFGFGACFVIYAVLVASRYGAARFSDVYPLIFLAYGAAGIAGPVTGGWLYDVSSRYLFSIIVSIGVVVGGLLVSGVLLRRSVHVSRER